MEFSGQLRPLCLFCIGTCAIPENIVGDNEEKLLSKKGTPEGACAIEGISGNLRINLN